MMSDAGSRAVQVYQHQVFPAARLHTLRVENVQGAIDVTGADAKTATVRYTKYAGHQDSIDNTQVIVDREDTDVDIHTNYVHTGWFGSRSAGVDYAITVPAGTSVHLANVSGPIVVRNMQGNVDIQQVSGDVTAALGRVAGDRDIRVNTVSGGTVISIARNSDVDLSVKTVSGSVHGFFPLNADKGFVGQAVSGRLGDGTASIDVNAVKGSVTIDPQ